MAQAHLTMAGVELPNTAPPPAEIAEVEDHLKHHNHTHDSTPDDSSIDKGIGGSDRHLEGDVRDPDGDLLQAQDMPEGPTVTRWEEWAYYMYYNGNNGVGPLNYAATQFQSLCNGSGYDPDTGGPCGDGQCVIKWGGRVRSVDSVVLIANGISFGIMTLLFTTIGSAADYGNVNRWILFISTIICWASQFAFMATWLPEHWKGAMALFMLGFITYGLTLVFYASIFPRLARNTIKTKTARRELDSGEISTHDYEVVEMLERNRLSNISTVHSNWGYLITLLLALALLLPSPIKDDPKVNNYVLVLTNGYWVLVGLPWFFVEKNRPGPPLPKGEHWLTIGWKQIWTALKQYRRLPYTFIYLFSFFLLADGLNTTGTMIGIVQNKHVEFSFLINAYLGIAQACGSIISCYSFWYIQRWRSLPTKRMFQVTNVITIFIPFWGMLGLWTRKVGFHNTWEFYAYNVVFGLGQAPYYAYSQTLMSDLCPPGFEGMFFGLFGITNRASSLIGPNVCAAIIDASGNEWHPFIFLFILCLLAALVITFFVDVDKGRAQAIAFSIEQRGLTGEVRAQQAAPSAMIKH